MDLKPPASVEQQITRLREHNLEMDLPDNEVAEILSKVNYYRLSGFSFQFREKDNKDLYKDGTTFSKIYNIYLFDCELHTLLFKYLLQYEYYARTKIALQLSLNKCTSSPYGQHYKFYGSFSPYEKPEMAENVFQSLEREKKYRIEDNSKKQSKKQSKKEDDFIIHHKEFYDDKMPLWVAVELLSFSNLSKLYTSLNGDYRRLIADSMNINQSILKSHLHSFSKLRNNVAHGNRLYNKSMNPEIRLGKAFLKKYGHISNSSLFSYIMALIEDLPELTEKQIFLTQLIKLVSLYEDSLELFRMGFPSNWKALLKEIARKTSYNKNTQGYIIKKF